MKVMIKASSIFVLLIMAVSCATTPTALPEKYNLDEELEVVKQITTFTVSGWEEVDIQSVILRANVRDYYLLVLRRPMHRRISGMAIGISSSVSSIRAGFDRIYVKDLSGKQHYVIEKIYKLEGREHAKEIKERLRKS